MVTSEYFDGVLAAEFLDHAASTSLNRFGLDVDRRGILGGDQADVLFFSEGWEAKEVKQFRHYLLQNDDIRTAYDSSEQHPDWLPHLTLGYPETPAKPNPTDYGLSWVRFDRIALWVGDSQGPEFVLNKRDLEVSMGTEMVENVLAHYGKKGMKWGVRNDKGHEGEKVTTKKLAKLDKKFAKKAGSAKAYAQIHNAAATNFNKKIVEINKKYSGKDLGFNPLTGQYESAAGKAYIKEAQKLADAGVKKALDDYGMNPSGTKRLEGRGDALSGTVKYYWVDVKHSDEEAPFSFTFVFSSEGLITELKPDIAAHSAIDDILAHYGVKGMKWGVTTKSSTPKMKSSDAKLAEKASAKARKSGVRSLTNKELQALNQRLNLEQNYSNLTKNDSNIATVRKGHSAVKEILSVGTTVTTAYALATSPVGKAVVKKLK